MKFDNKTKKRLKSILFVIICILIYSWATISGMEMWLNCAILDVNSQNVSEDVSKGYLTEVSVIKSNGDFTLVNDDTQYTEDVISEYIRVPNNVKYYYNKDTKQFVSKLTLAESRDLMLKFVVLDIVCTIMLIMIMVWAYKGRLWKRVCTLLLMIISIFFSQLAYEVAIGVLFQVKDNLWVIMLSKVVILIGVFVVRYFIRRYKTKPIRLKKHK